MNRLRYFLQSSFIFGSIAPFLFPLCFLTSTGCAQAGQRWSAIGPAGGDARSFAAVPGDPNHLYVGTTNSWLYESLDAGASWRRLAKLDSYDDLILDHIVVDRANPATLFVAAWRLDHDDGGLWVSRDKGQSWSEVEALRGQSIRAFAQSPSAPEMLYAGTLEGVFRTSDGGLSWRQISPPGSHEIHEVESLAIDPLDPDTIYAGTWHLPWKSSDGGKNWQSIKDGIIDDSDVFSIILDASSPGVVFASACSGIYRSVNAGKSFRAIKGIPSEARRTRVLLQDPVNFKVVYAGTTEGLYKSVDGGVSFQRMTGPEVIVNDIFVDPRDDNHLLLATDRGGVLMSRDGAASFTASNEGFSGRKVEALLVERGGSGRIFAGVVNDKSYGGVFVSGKSGEGWKQIGEGLDGRDVFALAESPKGEILAGSNHGLFALQEGDQGARWLPRGAIQNALPKSNAAELNARPTAKTSSAAKVPMEKDKPAEKPAATHRLDRVISLDLSGDAWLAATNGGLFLSKDEGVSWRGGPVMGAVDYLSVAAQGSLLAAARAEDVAFSSDAGLSWSYLRIPAMLTRIHSVAFSADGAIWLGAREGVYLSHDQGKTWMWVYRFPLSDVDALYYDAKRERLLVSSRSSDQVYLIDPKTLKWRCVQTGYRVAQARSAAGGLLAASLFDGVLIEPVTAQMEAGQP